jgi:hypothetical protein
MNQKPPVVSACITERLYFEGEKDVRVRFSRKAMESDLQSELTFRLSPMEAAQLMKDLSGIVVELMENH